MNTYKSKTGRIYEIEGTAKNCTWDEETHDWKLIDDTRDGFVLLKDIETDQRFAIDFNYQSGRWVGRPTNNGSIDYCRTVEL